MRRSIGRAYFSSTKNEITETGDLPIFECPKSSLPSFLPHVDTHHLSWSASQLSRFAERQIDAMVAHYSVMTFLERQYAVVAQSSGSAPDNHSHFASWKMMPSV